MRTGDGYIINQCLNGTPAAFGMLVEKYKSGIYALAYTKLRNFQDAEDITQEAFLIAYQKLSSLRRWDNFFAWLYSITSNLCKKFLQSQSKRPDREYVEDQDEEILDEPSMNAYHEEQVYESLREAVDALPEIYREVVTLYYLGGMKSREIAAFLGTSKDTIDKRLSRTRSKLREEMTTMMATAFEQRRLQPSFTFRVVELIKQIKIQPAPRTTGIPFGLSVTGGLILTSFSHTVRK